MTSRAVRETYVSNLVSFRVKTTKLWRFYDSREKDEIVGNENREKEKGGWRQKIQSQLILSAHFLARESRSIKIEYESNV